MEVVLYDGQQAVEPGSPVVRVSSRGCDSASDRQAGQGVVHHRKSRPAAATYTQNSAKPPAALRSAEYSLTLLLSTHDDYVSQALGSIALPSSAVKPSPRGRHDLPPRQGEPAFQPQPEIFHTFEPEEKTIGFLKSALGTVFVLAPWILLAGLVSHAWGSAYGQYTKISPTYAGLSGYSTLFLGTLAALEGLIVIYWLQLQLYQFLPIFLPLSLVTAYTGRLALSNKK